MKSKQDILNAFRERFGEHEVLCGLEEYPHAKCSCEYPEIIKWLLTTLTEFEREIYKEVDKKIWEVIDTRMEHVDDGIYDWKVNPKDTFFADDLKNELKNITFELEKEKHPSK